MRRMLITAQIMMLAAVAACGGSSEPEVSRTADGAECSTITNPAATLNIAANLLGRLKNDEAWKVSYNEDVLRPNESLDAIESLRQLSEYETKKGSVDEALDYYKKALELAVAASKSPQPAQTPEGKELAAMVPDLAKFLGYQQVIVEAREKAGC